MNSKKKTASLPADGKTGDRIKASPLAKKMAGAQGVSLGSITGSGPGGRVVKKDLETAPTIAPNRAPIAAAWASQQEPLSIPPKTTDASTTRHPAHTTPNYLICRPPALETRRLILRPLQETDAKAIFSYANNPNVSHYTMWEPHRTLEDSQAFIKDNAWHLYSQGVPGPFGIVLKEDPERVIGTVGCFWVSKPHHCMELGYALAEPFWGLEIVAEAAEAVVDFVFKNLPVERLQCRCSAEHARSARVMEKLGMRHEGLLRSVLFHRDRYWDMLYYSLLRPEWQASISQER